MKRYLLDTNTASALITKQIAVAAAFRAKRSGGGRIGIGIPVLAELYYGVEKSVSREKNLENLKRALADLVVWPFDEAAAHEFGRLRAEVERIGRSRATMDLLIASIARSLGDCCLVTADKDFAVIPGIRIENWLDPSG